MIRNVHIENYKSIERLKVELGRLTVLIGANGSGKSNILEAITLASVAAQDKLDNEFLSARGIRVTETRFMRSAFEDARPAGDAIRIAVSGDRRLKFECQLRSDETSSYPKWQDMTRWALEAAIRKAQADLDDLGTHGGDADVHQPHVRDAEVYLVYLLNELASRSSRSAGALPGFLVYSPENSSLRIFQGEGQTLPLGINGEGLFAHLKALNTDAHPRSARADHAKAVADRLVRALRAPRGSRPRRAQQVRIRDRYLAAGALFDQRSANEGFLFLLFYFTLLISPETPAFFAIDNIDASLNPKLCSTLLRELATLAAEHGKQVIVTTHNPAILDGLDLNDDEQRLLIIDRDKDGCTTARRVHPPKPLEGEPPVKLSEAFLRGYIGGLPRAVKLSVAPHLA